MCAGAELCGRRRAGKLLVDVMASQLTETGLERCCSSALRAAALHHGIGPEHEVMSLMEKFSDTVTFEEWDLHGEGDVYLNVRRKMQFDGALDKHRGTAHLDREIWLAMVRNRRNTMFKRERHKRQCRAVVWRKMQDLP